MTFKSRVLAGLSAAGLAAAMLVGPALDADAALTTRCVGEAGAVTVPGNLVVPKDKSCVMDGTTVEGRVTVQAGANLIVTNGTFNDIVVVKADGYLDMVDTTVAKRVTSQGGFGIYVERSSMNRLVETGAGDITPFIYAYDVSVNGEVKVTDGELYLDSSDAGKVTTDNSLYSDLINSTVSGAVSVTGAQWGSHVCESEVDGAASFTDNGGVQLGGGTLFGTCEGSNYFGGDVTISGTTGGVEVNGNIIRGDLGGEGNDPAPTGDDNRVRGESTGQFADLGPAVTTFSARSAKSAPAEHSAAAKQAAAERSAAAEAAAAAVGNAGL